MLAHDNNNNDNNEQHDVHTYMHKSPLRVLAHDNNNEQQQHPWRLITVSKHSVKNVQEKFAGHLASDDVLGHHPVLLSLLTQLVIKICTLPSNHMWWARGDAMQRGKRNHTPTYTRKFYCLYWVTLLGPIPQANTKHTHKSSV